MIYSVNVLQSSVPPLFAAYNITIWTRLKGFRCNIRKLEFEVCWNLFFKTLESKFNSEKQKQKITLELGSKSKKLYFYITAFLKSICLLGFSICVAMNRSYV